MDNLASADVVTADGKFVTASAHENEDLFWGLRGGGGNFGVVTSLKYRLHEVDQVFAGPIFYNLEDAAALLTVRISSRTRAWFNGPWRAGLRAWWAGGWV